MSDANRLHEVQQRNRELSAQLVHSATEVDITIAIAESLTAGALAATIADTPGASAVLRGGFVVYATELKATLAGVDEELLRERGPVDPDVARQLAQGARERCGADLGIGLTGVAGPDPQNGHPVGEVYLGVASPSGVRSEKLALADEEDVSREAIRLLTVQRGLLSLLAEVRALER